MPEENNNGSATNAGSPNDLIQSGPSANGDGGNANAGSIGELVSGDKAGVSPEEHEKLQKQFSELENKLGTQGQEVGELRSFIRSIEPVLDQLEQSPEFLQALMDGKIDSSMVEAVLQGKVNPDDAQTVTEAHKKVKDDMGKKAYAKATPEEIETKVQNELKKQEEVFEKKLQETKESIEASLRNENSLRDFQDEITDFIKNTEDYPQYAEGVYEWLDKHPNVDDIETAYNAVKAAAIVKAAEEESKKTRVDMAKEIAANAGGGSSQNANIINDTDVVDNLISGTSNPNRV